MRLPSWCRAVNITRLPDTDANYDALGHPLLSINRFASFHVAANRMQHCVLKQPSSSRLRFVQLALRPLIFVEPSLSNARAGQASANHRLAVTVMRHAAADAKTLAAEITQLSCRC